MPNWTGIVRAMDSTSPKYNPGKNKRKDPKSRIGMNIGNIMLIIRTGMAKDREVKKALRHSNISRVFERDSS